MLNVTYRLEMNTINLSSLIRSRRTPNPNQFIDKKVDIELLVNAIDDARHAPNHYTTEPTQFYILSEQQKKDVAALLRTMIESSGTEEAKEIAKLKEKIWAKTPAIIIVSTHTPKDSRVFKKHPEIELEDYATTATVIQNLTLLLLEQNLHVKWSTKRVDLQEGFREAVGMRYAASDEVVSGILLIGYLPDDKVLTERKLKDLNDVLKTPAN